jgi:hypothetical protein
VVHKARNAHLERFVALKVLPPEKFADSERKRRFVQEVAAGWDMLVFPLGEMIGKIWMTTLLSK